MDRVFSHVFVRSRAGAYTNGQLATACAKLTDFLSQVSAQRGKALTGSQATQLNTGAGRATEPTWSPTR